MTEREVMRLMRAVHELDIREREERYAQERANCLPLPRFRAALLRVDWTAAEREHIDGCAYCQKTLEKFQQELWHPTLSQLFLHSLSLLPSSDAAEVAYHLEQDRCQRCKQLTSLLTVIPKLKRLGEQVRQGAAGAMERLEKACESLTAPLQLIRPLVPQPAFDTGVTPTPTEQRLTFDDGLTTGVLYLLEGELWLHLERSDLPAGTLLQVMVADKDGQVAWRRFIVLRVGFEARVAKARVGQELPDNSLLTVDVVSVAELTADEAELLSESFMQAQTDDPSAVPAWKAWAQRALERETLDLAVRAVIEDIGRGGASVPARDFFATWQWAAITLTVTKVMWQWRLRPVTCINNLAKAMSTHARPPGVRSR